MPDEFKSAPVYTGEVHQNITWSKHTEEYEHESCGRNCSNHRTATYLATDTSTYKTADKHHKPIHCNEQTYSSNGDTLCNQVLLYEVRHTNFNTHIKENSQSAESKVAETKCTSNQLTSGKCATFFFFFYRLINLGEKNHNECDSEDSESNEQRRRGVRDASLTYICNECTHEDVASHSSRRVKHTTKLDELVTRVTTTTKDIEHRVHHTVEDSHTETCDESTSKIYSKHQTEVFLCVELTAKPLDSDTHHTDNETTKGCFLVTILRNKQTCGDTHNKISHEVTIVTNLSQHIGDRSLVFNDCCHGCAQVSHKGNHSEEGNHHNNRAPLFGFLSH